MSAPKGNQYWKLANNWKKPKSYQPDEFLDKAIEYAKWCEDHPLYESKLFGTGLKGKVSKMRVMTIQGFCCYANINSSTFYEYEKQEAYSKIIRGIRDIFEANALEGAASGLLESNIVARLLGLVDKQERKVTNLEPVVIKVIESTHKFASSESEVTDQEKK